MDLVQHRITSQQVRSSRRNVYAAAVFLAFVVVVAIAATLLLRTMTATASSTGGLGSEEWRQFRAGERSTVSQADPFLAPAFIQFRQSERGEAAGN